MKRIVKTVIPEPLMEAKKKRWNWDQFVQNDHDGYLYCRGLASADQGDVCGYTELSLVGKGSRIHLDHFRKKSIFPNLTFDWNNLVCAIKDARFGADFKDGIVDGMNSASVYSSILNPVTDEAQAFFYYDTDGVMHPLQSLEEKERAKAAQTIKVFNLNEGELVSRRRTLIAQLQSCIDLSAEDIRLAFSDSGFPTVLDQELQLRLSGAQMAI